MILRQFLNRALRSDDRDAVIALKLQDAPPRPPNAERMRMANRGKASVDQPQVRP